MKAIFGNAKVRVVLAILAALVIGWAAGASLGVESAREETRAEMAVEMQSEFVRGRELGVGLGRTSALADIDEALARERDVYSAEIRFLHCNGLKGLANAANAHRLFALPAAGEIVAKGIESVNALCDSRIGEP